MANLLSLEATLDLATKGFETGIKKAEELGKSLLGKLGDISKGAATTAVHAIEGIGKAALVATGAVTALGSSFIPLVKQAADAFGDYEQLVGGVQTLFKEDWEFVVQDANQAFATVGMSANQYMETATSFAASMVKSVGGNTYLAAQMTKTAMVDIADNVNKMGTSFESVEYAYKGFAKQNYTMLDNLKLGYGGTKKEMERLLKDADEINAKQGKITHYSMENFSDIVDAIHVVQEEMGITGTTAEEAKDTIQGSAASMRAAWQNVLTFLGNNKAKGKLVQAIRAFAETAKTYLGNLVPVIETAVSNLPLLIRELAPDVAELIPDLISGVLPSIVDAGMNVGQALIDGVFKLLSPSKMAKLVGDIGKRVNINLTKLLGLKKDASFTDIVAAAADKLREAVAHIGGAAKVTIASLLGLVKTDGTVNIDPNDVTWTQIGIEIAKRVAEAPKLVKVGICHLLGLTTEGGDPITDADQVKWSAIAQAIVDKVQTASGVVKLALAALLGLTGENGDPITDANEVSWGDIAQSIVDSIKTAQTNTKGFLADLLGLKYNSVDDISWGDIARGLIRNLKEQLGGVNLFGDILDVTVEGLTAIVDFASAIGLELVSYLSDPSNLTAFATALGTLVTGTLEKAPEWITALGDLATNLITAFSDPEIMKGIISAIIDSMIALAEKLPELAGAFGGFIDAIFESIGLDTNFRDTFRGLMEAISALVSAIAGIFFTKDEETGEYKMQDWFKTLLQVTLDTISTAVQAIAVGVDLIAGIIDSVFGDHSTHAEQDLTDAAGAKGGKISGNLLQSQLGTQWWSQVNQYAEGHGGLGLATQISDEWIKALNDAESIEAANKLLEGWGFEFRIEADDTSVEEAAETVEGVKTGLENLDGKSATIFIKTALDEGPSSGITDFASNYLYAKKNRHAKGLWTVPYDDYVADLHRGEMVLTASQARDYRDGGGMDSEAIVSAIGGLRNDIQNLKLVVGRKQFGKAVVDYSGKAMQDAIGRSEDATYAGYGWG